MSDAREKLTRRRKKGWRGYDQSFMNFKSSLLRDLKGKLAAKLSIVPDILDFIYIYIYFIARRSREGGSSMKQGISNAKKFGKIYQKIREKKRRKGKIERIFHENAIFEYILREKKLF